jgi:hypothetical protein
MIRPPTHSLPVSTHSDHSELLLLLCFPPMMCMRLISLSSTNKLKSTRTIHKKVNNRCVTLWLCHHYYKMWVQFTDPCSLDQWIHYFFTGLCSLQTFSLISICYKLFHWSSFIKNFFIDLCSLQTFSLISLFVTTCEFTQNPTFSLISVHYNLWIHSKFNFFIDLRSLQPVNSLKIQLFHWSLFITQLVNSLKIQLFHWSPFITTCEFTQNSTFSLITLFITTCEFTQNPTKSFNI